MWSKNCKLILLNEEELMLKSEIKSNKYYSMVEILQKFIKYKWHIVWRLIGGQIGVILKYRFIFRI